MNKLYSTLKHGLTLSILCLSFAANAITEEELYKAFFAEFNRTSGSPAFDSRKVKNIATLIAEINNTYSHSPAFDSRKVKDLRTLIIEMDATGSCSNAFDWTKIRKLLRELKP